MIYEVGPGEQYQFDDAMPENEVRARIWALQHKAPEMDYTAPEEIVRANLAGISDEKLRTLGNEAWARMKLARQAPRQGVVQNVAGALDDVSQAAARGAFLETADEGQGALAGIANTVTSGTGDPRQRQQFADERTADVRVQNENFQREHPIISGASTLTGGVAGALTGMPLLAGAAKAIPGIARIAGGVSRMIPSIGTRGAPGVIARTAANTGKGAVAGGTGAAVSNIGAQQGNLQDRFNTSFNDGTLAGDVKTGAGFGAAGGAVASTLGELLGRYVRTKFPTGAPDPAVSAASGRLAPDNPLPSYLQTADPAIQGKGAVEAASGSRVGRELTVAQRNFEDQAQQSTQDLITRTTGAPDPSSAARVVGERFKPDFDQARAGLTQNIEDAATTRNALVPDDARTKAPNFRQKRVDLYRENKKSFMSGDLSGTSRLAGGARRGLLSFKGALRARQAIGEQLPGQKGTTISGKPVDMNMSKTTRGALYSGLTKDLRELAEAKGGRGADLVRLDREIATAAERRRQLGKFYTDKSEEKLVKDLYAGADAGSANPALNRTRRFMSYLTPDTRSAASGAALGQATMKGGQSLPLTEAGARIMQIGPDGRRLLFNSSPEVAQRADDIATTGSRLGAATDEGSRALQGAASGSLGRLLERLPTSTLGAIAGAVSMGQTSPAHLIAGILGGATAPALFKGIHNDVLRAQLLYGNLAPVIENVATPLRAGMQGAVTQQNVDRASERERNR